MEKLRIGIDLGTTNTLACYMKNGKPTLIKFPLSGKMLPSILYLEESGAVLVGGLARKKGKSDPLNMIRSSKTHMGDFDKKWTLRGRDFTPTDVAAEILREVRKAVLKKTDGNAEIEAVITVPAYFTANQIDETKKAGESAGLTVLGIITEPRAAAIANIRVISIENQKILVADLGGGTFDVSILEAGRREYRTLAVDGDRRLGGDDFDTRLAAYIQKFIEDDLGLDLSSQSASGLEYNTYHTMMASILDAACEAKTELSEEESYDLIAPNLFPYKGGTYSLQLTITRAQFEELCADLFQKVRNRILKIFTDNPSIKPENIGSVILAGGSCYIPKVKADVEALMNRSADTIMDRSTMVAVGACFVADSWDNPILDEEDIISHSLGIEVLREDGTAVLAKLLNRNDVYPCSQTHVFTTTADNQESVNITIYEAGSDMEDVPEIERISADGTSRNIHDLYGSFILDGIQKAKKGVPKIQVTFEYDRSRILTVTAEDLVTGAKKRIEVTKGMRAEAPRETVEPVDFELLIDVSYSMEGTPLRQAKEASCRLVENIIDLSVHQLGIVSFGSKAREVCPLSADRARLTGSIQSLYANGGTDMTQAINLGKSILNKSQRRRVLLIVTDGAPNNGVTTKAAAQQAKATGIDIITIAAGAGADRDYLRTLVSDERYAFSIKSMDQLADMFQTVVAQYLADVKNED